MMSVPAFSIPVSGFLGFSGPGVLTFSLAGSSPGMNFIDFCPVNSATEPSAGCGAGTMPGQGTLNVDSRNGTFVAFDPVGSSGTILDITDNPAPPPGFTYIPLGAVPAPGIVNFLNFADPWTYTLTSLTPQVCAPSATLVCAGYFSLLQVGNNVSANLAGAGTITAGADVNPFNLLITGNFSGTTIAQVVAAAQSPSGIFSNSWSGELNATAIPEPGSVTLALLGLALLGGASLRKQRKL